MRWYTRLFHSVNPTISVQYPVISRDLPVDLTARSPEIGSRLSGDELMDRVSVLAHYSDPGDVCTAWDHYGTMPQAHTVHNTA